jgi:sulfonate transport system substrate-binding protein
MMTAKVRALAFGLIWLATMTVLEVGSASAQSKLEEVRIGFQKSSTLLTILKSHGTLEKAFQPLGLKVKWSEFTSGLPLLEALNVGAIDISADVADTVPVFAQAAGAKLTYIAREAGSPSAEAIVVAANSPLSKVADLKGKKVAVTKAAGVHYLLIVALERAGLGLKDIEPAYLTPGDARVALESGSVAAWVTWDPFLAAVQHQAKARILEDGRGLVEYQRYYLAATPFAEVHPNIIALIFTELRKTGRWVKDNEGEAAALLTPLWGLDAGTVALANTRRSYAVREVVPENLAEQQKIADAFFAAGLLPKKINATDVAIWKPGS